jgi:hypothetical protein
MKQNTLPSLDRLVSDTKNILAPLILHLISHSVSIFGMQFLIDLTLNFLSTTPFPFQPCNLLQGSHYKNLKLC